MDSMFNTYIAERRLASRVVGTQSSALSDGHHPVTGGMELFDSVGKNAMAIEWLSVEIIICASLNGLTLWKLLWQSRYR